MVYCHKTATLYKILLPFVISDKLVHVQLYIFLFFEECFSDFGYVGQVNIEVNDILGKSSSLGQNV